MSEKSSERTYFRTSTASQRKKLFEVWEKSGSVKKSLCSSKIKLSHARAFACFTLVSGAKENLVVILSCVPLV